MLETVAQKLCQENRKQKTGMTETAIRITNLSKCHEIYGYGTPTDWLKQTSCPNLKNRS